MSCTEAEQSRGFLRDYIAGERHLGQAEALYRAHLKTGLTERRLLSILRGQVPRIWADEWTALREWHSSWLEQREARLLHEIEIMRARRAEITAR